MIEFLTALGLAIALEGLLFSLFPNGMRNRMLQVLELSDNVLRTAGLLAMLVGVGLIAFLRHVLN